MAIRRGISNKYLIVATASFTGAAISYQTLNPNSLPDFPFLNGVIRSSRALFTITSNVVDYKYSLFGFTPDTDEYRVALSEVHLRSAKRILKTCDTNKGIYVKAGQFVAAIRQVPKEYSSSLSSLQDQAVPCPFEAIKEVLLNNLGPNLSEIFLSFNEQPVAAASIAQVHHAVLKDRQEVAVKVQYPGLEYQMRFDLATMSFLSKSVGWLFPGYRFQWLVSEFEKSIASELEGPFSCYRSPALVEVPHEMLSTCDSSKYYNLLEQLIGSEDHCSPILQIPSKTKISCASLSVVSSRRV